MPYGHDDAMKLLDNALFGDLCEEAEESPRRRVHHLIHESHQKPVQRLVVALQPGTYFRPHRHSTPPKWELVLVLNGAAAWIGFDEQGRVTGDGVYSVQYLEQSL